MVPTASPTGPQRGQYVYDQLTATADASQAELSATLTKQKVTHQRFWAANTILVKGGDQSALNASRTTAGVARVRAPQTYAVPEPIKSSDGGASVNSLEWGITNINADDVWSDYGVAGEDIVVANIDTGVQFDHPALVNQYRGNQGGGVFDHNYNWFDPSSVCGDPSLVPCDNNDHGTHTMGTMVGDDGGANQIGVAPGARWIAAKGCESSSCSDAALLASGQWVLAPTNLAGASPNPALRPHIINNSWGGSNGAPSTIGTAPRSRRGRPRACSACSRTAIAGPAATPPARLPTTSSPTPSAPTTATTTSPASPAAVPARAARSARPSRPPATTCAPASPAAATTSSTAPRWRPPTCAGAVALLWSLGARR